MDCIPLKMSQQRRRCQYSISSSKQGNLQLANSKIKYSSTYVRKYERIHNRWQELCSILYLEHQFIDTLHDLHGTPTNEHEVVELCGYLNLNVAIAYADDWAHLYYSFKD